MKILGLDTATWCGSLGIIGAAFGLGFVLGPAIGGLLSQRALSTPGYAAALLGASLLLVPLGLATLMFCFHYIPYKKKVEGDRLKKIFGQPYEDYDERVPDYLPRWTPYSDRRAHWKFRTFWENSEAGIVVLNLLGILVILSRPYWKSLF